MEVTDLLRLAHQGDQNALNVLVPQIYRELKSLAASQLRREAGVVRIQATDLVHETFLRFTGSRFPDCESRSHFYGIAARVMRQVLVDMARSRNAAKRGAGHECTLTDLPEMGSFNDERILELHDALDRLAETSSLKGRLIELRFFAGLTAEESAEVMSLSVHLVRRELRLAQAWLRRELAMP